MRGGRQTFAQATQMLSPPTSGSAWIARCCPSCGRGPPVHAQPERARDHLNGAPAWICVCRTTARTEHTSMQDHLHGTTSEHERSVAVEPQWLQTSDADATRRLLPKSSHGSHDVARPAGEARLFTHNPRVLATIDMALQLGVVCAERRPALNRRPCKTACMGRHRKTRGRSRLSHTGS